jgi:diguanylate cyclase (GGDEF)-like protein/PAS domain S-box-containing protein
MALTILIVEDNEDDQQLYRRALRSSGHILVMSTSAQEGLARAAEAHPGLILLDFNLPDMDGLGFLENFADRGVASIPVIMLTGEGSESIAVAAMKAGASDYLVKDVAGDYLRLLPNVVRRTVAAHEEQMHARRLGDLNEAILGTVADGILGVDADGKILSANPAAERMLLCQSSQIVGQHLTQYLRTSDLAVNWIDHPLAQPHDGLLTLRRDCDQFQRAGGTSFPINYTASPLDFKGDGQFGWVIAFQDITERKQAEEELYKIARYDSLTGLPNRLMFQDYFSKSLKRMARKAQHLALLFLDLDDFKRVNDSHGHLVGDQVLQLVAQRLVKCVREGDLVSRFGGDEFTILAEDCELAQLAGFSQRIIDELEAPMIVNGSMMQISVTIGIALHPECGSDERTLIHNADAAMYKVKRDGSQRYGFCSDLETLIP